MLRRSALALVLVAAVALAGCASMPHAKFAIGGFGVELSVDTRNVTDAISGAVTSATDAVGLTAPTPAPAAECTGTSCDAPK